MYERGVVGASKTIYTLKTQRVHSFYTAEKNRNDFERGKFAF